MSANYTGMMSFWMGMHSEFQRAFRLLPHPHILPHYKQTVFTYSWTSLSRWSRITRETTRTLKEKEQYVKDISPQRLKTHIILKNLQHIFQCCMNCEWQEDEGEHTGLPLGPSSPGGPLGPGGPAVPAGPPSPFSPRSPLGPCGNQRFN